MTEKSTEKPTEISTEKQDGKLKKIVPGKLRRKKTLMAAAQLFHENEVDTNRLSANAMLAFAVFTFCLSLVAHTTFYNIGADWCINLVVADSFLFLLTYLIARASHFNKPWLKDVLLVSALLFSAVIYFLYPMSSAFLIFGPILLSTRYYNGKLTFRISLATWLCYVIVMQLSLVLNSRVAAVRELREYLEITIFNYPEVLWKYHIAPRSFVIAITGVLGVLAAENGRKLIVRQAESAQKAATLETQLSLAAEIQTRALPPGSFETPCGGYQLSCSMNPAKEVGGDFYDYFMLGDDRLAVLIADVSDKGLPAAMFMMAAHNALRLCLEICPTVGEAFQKVNEDLCKANQKGMFVTVWGGIIDLKTGKGEFVNAGHTQPLIKRAETGKTEWVINEPDLFLGVFPDATFGTNLFALEPGDCLILYTDGVTDAQNKEKERYGTVRLQEKADALPCHARALREGITADVQEFYRDMPQFDDITMLVCERNLHTGTG